MDLLDFGMKNRESKSWIRRSAAEVILGAAKLRADMYEWYLKKKEIHLLENPLRDKQMLQRIFEQADQYQKTEKKQNTFR